MARKKLGSSWGRVVSDRAKARADFEQMVADAIDALPDEFRDRLDNVAIVVEDEPDEPLLGLYRGVPQPDRGMGYSWVLPDKITIYRKPLEARARSREHLAAEVRKTVIHEVAHHFGIDDDRLHELGWS